MVRSLIETERCRSVKKRVYLPDVDEYRSSSRPLSGKSVNSREIVRGKRGSQHSRVSEVREHGGCVQCVDGERGEISKECWTLARGAVVITVRCHSHSHKASVIPH